MLGAQGKPEVLEKAEPFVGSANRMRGIRMDSVNPEIPVCIVCKHFIVADRATIRECVFHEALQNLGHRNAIKVKKSLCAKHHTIGFAPSQDRRKAGQSSDAPEAGVQSGTKEGSLLPTFLDTINGRLIHWKTHKWSWTLHYRRFLRRNNRQS